MVKNSKNLAKLIYEDLDAYGTLTMSDVKKLSEISSTHQTGSNALSQMFLDGKVLKIDDVVYKTSKETLQKMTDFLLNNNIFTPQVIEDVAKTAPILLKLKEDRGQLRRQIVSSKVNALKHNILLFPNKLKSNDLSYLRSYVGSYLYLYKKGIINDVVTASNSTGGVKLVLMTASKGDIIVNKNDIIVNKGAKKYTKNSHDFSTKNAEDFTNSLNINTIYLRDDLLEMLMSKYGYKKSSARQVLCVLKGRGYFDGIKIKNSSKYNYKYLGKPDVETYTLKSTPKASNESKDVKAPVASKSTVISTTTIKNLAKQWDTFTSNALNAKVKGLPTTAKIELVSEVVASNLAKNLPYKDSDLRDIIVSYTTLSYKAILNNLKVKRYVVPTLYPGEFVVDDKIYGKNLDVNHDFGKDDAKYRLEIGYNPNMSLKVA